MAGEWKAVPLGQLYEFTSGLSKPSSAFGFGYPFLSFKDVFYNSAVPPHLTGLVDSTEEERARCSIRRGDVFLTRTSETQDELGMSCVALNDVDHGTFNGFTKRLRPRTAEVLPEYARYYFRSAIFRQSVTAMSTLSTRASLNNEMLHRLFVVVPPLDEQGRIAEILGALDGKIELNHRMDETLEQMARALFSSWFQRFDPVRARLAGHAATIPSVLLGSVPSTFEESELGQIPSGWRVGRLDDLLVLQRGFDLPASERHDGHIPVISASGEHGYHDESRAAGPGVVTGRSGVIGRVILVADDFWPLNTTLWVKEFRKVGPFYAYQLLQTLSFADFNAGSAVPTLNRNHVHSLPVVIPDSAFVREFEEQASVFHSKQRQIAGENRTLAQLRDTLLPKLLSGELRVATAEKELAQHV